VRLRTVSSSTRCCSVQPISSALRHRLFDLARKTFGELMGAGDEAGAEDGTLAGTRRRSMGLGIRSHVGVDGAPDLFGLGQLQESVIVPHLQAGEVEGVIAQFDALTHQKGSTW